MEVLSPKTNLTPSEFDEFLGLVATVESTTGRPQLSDQSRLALEQAAAARTGTSAMVESDGFLAFVPVREGAVLVAFAQLSRSSSGWTLDVVSDTANPLSDDALGDLVRSGIASLGEADEIAVEAGERLAWWRDGSASGRVESALGFELDRELFQMRRRLPTGLPVTIATRSFVPGEDEEAFLTVNNRAFADHHEQSSWTIDMVRARESTAWFDPDGFRLYERDGRLAGFCWTKIHSVDSLDALGEIYVIAVDPDFAGRGLGKQLTLAGLDHLARIGIETAMLYVDADNIAAVSMYERLGFTVHSSSKAFSYQLADHPSTRHPST